MNPNDENAEGKEFIGRQKSGKAGGEATKQKHGADFFRMIGKKGGKAKGEPAKAKPESEKEKDDPSEPELLHKKSPEPRTDPSSA